MAGPENEVAGEPLSIHRVPCAVVCLKLDVKLVRVFRGRLRRKLQQLFQQPGLREPILNRHGAEQYAGDLECVFYGYHLDRAILKIAEAAAYCLMPSLLQNLRDA